MARDRALVTRAQGGDRAAFDDLYMRYYRRLYRFCLRRLHDSHEAEDVSQEAFARAWRALPTFAGDRRFYPWLSVIASHLCTDVLRRRNRSTPVAEFHQGNVASIEDGGEELVIAAVDSALVAKAFTRLSDRHQRILHLREGSGWSYQRIADHEGVGITAVETLLWRARQALKREFASLAGADGRNAAWLGGLLSAAALRKLVHLPRRALHKIATASAKGSAIAAGSAVAATAMIVGATLSTPGNGHTGILVSNAPTVSQELGSLLGGGANAPAGGAVSGGSATQSATGLGSTGGANLGAGQLPGVQSSDNPVSNAGSGLLNLGGQVDTNLGGTATNLGGTVNQVTGGLQTLLGGTSGGTTGLLTTPLGGVTSVSGSPTGAVSSTLSTTTGLLGNATKSLLGIG
ncbi:MAG: RNA polymerase sigma factor [Acidimicrobiales bacterium]